MRCYRHRRALITPHRSRRCRGARRKAGPTRASAIARTIASAVIGISRTRTPIASNTALPIAAATGPCVASPAPTDGASGRASRFHLDHRRFGEAQDRVALPAVGQHPAARLEAHPSFSVKLTAWIAPSLDLVAHAIGIDHQAHVDRSRSTVAARAPRARPSTSARHGAVRPAGVLVARPGQPLPACSPVAGCPMRPARAGALQHLDRARVVEVAQPERQRRLVQPVRDLVHEALQREHVAVGAERAQRGGADRHRQQAGGGCMTCQASNGSPARIAFSAPRPRSERRIDREHRCERRIEIRRGAERRVAASRRGRVPWPLPYTSCCQCSTLPPAPSDGGEVDAQSPD